MHSFRTVLIIAGLCCAVAACGGRRDLYEAELDTLGPFPYTGGLAFLNRTTSELLRLDQVERSAGELSFELDRIQLGRSGPRRLLEVDDGRKLAVLHDDPASPGISWLSRGGVERRPTFLALADAFDGLALSPSTRFGVAYFTGADTAHTGIRNLNQIQVIDFADDARVHPAMALETGGLNPRGIDFTPQMSGPFSELAAVRVDNGLVLVDLKDPEAPPLWVRFTNSPGGVAVPVQVAFGPFYPDGGYFYVRLQGADSVIGVHLTRDLEGRLRRSVNFLSTPAGSAPSDLLVLSDPQFADKVFVVYGGSSQKGAAILDANSIQTDEKTFSFDTPGSEARRLVGWGPMGIKEFVMVYSPNMTGSSPRVFLVDPISAAVEPIYLQDDYYRVSGPDEGGHAMFFHRRLGQSSEPGMRVVRAMLPEGSSRWTHRISSFGLSTEPEVHAFTQDGEAMLGAFKLGNTTFLLDLIDGQYQTMRLDEAPLAVGVVPGTDWAWFQHAHPLGSISLVPMDSFERESAIMFEGFMLAGLLDPS